MSRESRVYRIRQLPLHLEECGKIAPFLARIAPVLGAVDNIRCFSLAQEKSNSKTATVKFKTLPLIFDNDERQWTLQAEDFCGRNVIVDIHFRGFTILNEPRSSSHIADCIAISGLASHPFGSWKYREPGSDFMWLRDRLPQDVPQLRSLIYGYDTKLFKSHSFQDLDDIAMSFIASLKEIRRSLPPARSLFFLAHSLGGIVLKRAIILLADGSTDEEKTILESLTGMVFFGVPHKGMKVSHLLAMVAKQPNEDLISRTLSPDSPLLPELDKEFLNIALRINHNIKYVYETAESQLTEQTSTGTWIRSPTSYAVLVGRDSAVPLGTLTRNAIAVNEDHSNMVKFGEDDPVYLFIKSFLFDLSKKADCQGRLHRTPTDSLASQISPLSSQDPNKDGVSSSQKRRKAFSTVPFSKDPNFVGREDVLAQLESEFANPRSQSWASLYGLGGIGKSQIAIECSYRRKEQSPEISTFWVHASSKARFEQSYIDIARIAEIPGNGDGKVDILQLVSKWLADEDNGRWLLILDNADDITVLLNPSTRDIGTGAVPIQPCLLDFLPRVQHGAVLITTRDRSCALSLTGHVGTPIEVVSMTGEESVRLLRVRLPGAHSEEASELVEELENLPLAISQAGAYIKQVPRVSIPKYLEIFRRSDSDQVALLNKNKEDLRRDRGVPNAVITSWELSFDQIRRNSPDSADLLSLMSYFNRQAIPQFLIEGDFDDTSFEENINVLLSFSLIRAETREDIFEVHRLVQVAMQHWLRSEGFEQLWKERAIERVALRFPWIGQEERWPVCEDLMSHADEVVLYNASSKDIELNRANILGHTAWYLSCRKGDNELAEQRSRQAVGIQRQYLDESSDIVLRTLTVLAESLRGLWKFEEAISLQESILEQCSKDVGFDHRLALDAMHALAVSHLELGHYQKAEDFLKDVVEAKDRLLSPEDPDPLNPELELARVYLHLGKWEEAEMLLRNNLEILKRRHTLEHRDTLNAMYNLSVAYQRQYKLDEAEMTINQAIPLHAKVYGPYHQTTLAARLRLADIYQCQRRVDEAKEICLYCLDTAHNLPNPQATIIMQSTYTLGLIRCDQGDFIHALEPLQDALTLRQKFYGSDHPTTLVYIYDLACCYHGMGDKDSAIQLLTEVLKKQERVLPADHPSTRDSADLLAQWKGEEEDSEEWEAEEEGSELEEDEDDGEDEVQSEDREGEDGKSEDGKSEEIVDGNNMNEEKGSEEEENEVLVYRGRGII